MDPNIFTYHISSYDASSNNSANNCVIKLDRLPRNKRFVCEAVNFVINLSSLTAAASSGYITLVCTDLIANGVSTNKKAYDIICDCSIITGELKNKGATFLVDNFNGREINFQLINNLGTALPNSVINDTDTTTWNLTLRIMALSD